VKIAHWSGSMEVVAILSEFSSCLLEIFDAVLLFLVLHPWKQLFTNVHTVKRWWREWAVWSKGYSSLVREVWQNSGKDTWSIFWVAYPIATLYIQFQLWQVMYLCWPKKWSWQYTSSLETYSQIPVSKQKAQMHTSHCSQGCV